MVPNEDGIMKAQEPIIVVVRAIATGLMADVERARVVATPVITVIVVTLDAKLVSRQVIKAISSTITVGERPLRSGVSFS